MSLPSVEALLSESAAVVLLDASAFAPSAQARPATHRLTGVLGVDASPLEIAESFTAPRTVLGKRIDRFPALELPLVGTEDDLIPVSRRMFHPHDTESYWSVIPGPGRVWTEPDDTRWCRAAFPLTLTNAIDSGSYQGLALFLYDSEGRVSTVHLQLCEGGVPYGMPLGLNAKGRLRARFVPTRLVDADAVVASYKRETNERFRHRPWRELERRCEPALLDSVQSGIGAETAVVCALAVGEDIFTTSWTTAHGIHPYLPEIRHGIWSATKSAGAALALFHLAQRFGGEVLDHYVRELLDVEASHDGWEQVRLVHCLNMATGIGNDRPTPEPRDIFADYNIDPESHPESATRYRRFYSARTRRERLAAIFSADSYPWGPGEVVRYRDQEFFTLSAAMQRLFERRGGNGDMWDAIRADVYEPIGVHHAAVNRTTEPDGSAGVALLGGGLFLTIEEAVRIARLFQSHGRYETSQLLHRDQVIAATDPWKRKGLATGHHTRDGEILYHMGFWHMPYRTRGGRQCLIACMLGYGGNRILLFPNGMTGVRFAHDDPQTEQRYDVLTLARIADAIDPF